MKKPMDETAAVRILDRLLLHGYMENASDIHLEPREHVLCVRMRIDGQLLEYETFGMELHPGLVARVKILSGMDIAEKRVPQDGHIKTEVGGIEMNIRTSTIPTIHGEKAVLRFLDRNVAVDHAERFGMNEENYRKVLDILRRPNGILYFTGPTGSGKTTTLYMILERLMKRPVNIITIEDPVERSIDGINQMQVNEQAGLTFETGLRAALRQDPDVIMIGETRDSTTARISVRAAVTGHLVLSTLHTNDAVSAIARMADMEVEPFLTADSLSGVVFQRLVRKVCPSCAVEEEGTMADFGIRKIRRGKGCELCRHTGYKGRMAVHEVLVVDREIRKMIGKGCAPEEIYEYAVKTQNFTPIKTDILRLVEAGITSEEEFWRLTYGQ